MPSVSGIDYTINGWRAWYSEGRVFESTLMAWHDLPDIGVLIVRIYFRTRPYSRYMSGSSYYWCAETIDGPLYAHGDPRDAIIPQRCWDDGMVKKGLWVLDGEMSAAHIASVAAETSPAEALRIDFVRKGNR